MIIGHIPGLDELAFEGRNQEYGAYFIRKRYSRYLLISFAAGTLILLSAVFALWFYYYFKPLPLVEGDMLYMVEYYDMNALPDEEMNKLVQSWSKPLKEQEKAPVVKDTVKPEKEEPVAEKLVEKPADENIITDSAASPGGSGLGKGAGEDSGISTAVDVYPRYPGGDDMRLNYLRRQVKYPEAALTALVQGVVMVVFVVEVDGSITNVDAAKRIGGGCDEEAIRVTKEMPHWEPGKRNGRAVRVMVRMPIVFRIPGKPSK